MRRMGLVIDLLASHDPSVVGLHTRDELISLVRDLITAQPNWVETLATHFSIPGILPPELTPGMSRDEWFAGLVEYAKAMLAHRSEPLRKAFEENGNPMALVEMARRGWHHQLWVQLGLQALELHELGSDRKAQAVARYFLNYFYEDLRHGGSGRTKSPAEPGPRRIDRRQKAKDAAIKRLISKIYNLQAVGETREWAAVDVLADFRHSSRITDALVKEEIITEIRGMFDLPDDIAT